jgi:hypothetical protein
LQDEHAESKVYTRKLEARLEELKGAADLSSKLQVAKGKVGDWLACLYAPAPAALASHVVVAYAASIRSTEVLFVPVSSCCAAQRVQGGMERKATLLVLLCCPLQAHDLQQQLVSVSAELEAAREVMQQRDKEVDRLNRSAAGGAAKGSSVCCSSSSSCNVLSIGPAGTHM